MEDKGFYLKMDRSKFVVVYGMNNLGKTTATKALVEYLCAQQTPARYLKYAIYEMEPTGPRINAYLRSGNPEKLTPLQFQELQVQNRRDFEPQLGSGWKTEIGLLLKIMWEQVSLEEWRQEFRWKFWKK